MDCRYFQRQRKANIGGWKRFLGPWHRCLLLTECLGWLESLYRMDQKNTQACISREAPLCSFCDNLKGQKKLELKDAALSCGATDIWQPGYGQPLKVKIKQEFFRWLDNEENCEHWYGEAMFTASEKRILMTKWVGDVYREIFAFKTWFFTIGYSKKQDVWLQLMGQTTNLLSQRFTLLCCGSSITVRSEFWCNCYGQWCSNRKWRKRGPRSRRFWEWGRELRSSWSAGKRRAKHIWHLD